MKSSREIKEEASLGELIYLHKLYSGTPAVRGANEKSRTIEKLIETRLKLLETELV